MSALSAASRFSMASFMITKLKHQLLEPSSGGGQVTQALPEMVIDIDLVPGNVVRHHVSPEEDRKRKIHESACLSMSLDKCDVPRRLRMPAGELTALDPHLSLPLAALPRVLDTFHSESFEGVGCATIVDVDHRVVKVTDGHATRLPQPREAVSTSRGRRPT